MSKWIRRSRRKTRGERGGGQRFRDASHIRSQPNTPSISAANRLPTIAHCNQSLSRALAPFAADITKRCKHTRGSIAERLAVRFSGLNLLVDGARCLGLLLTVIKAKVDLPR